MNEYMLGMAKMVQEQVGSKFPVHIVKWRSPIQTRVPKDDAEGKGTVQNEPGLAVNSVAHVIGAVALSTQESRHLTLENPAQLEKLVAETAFTPLESVAPLSGVPSLAKF